MKTFKANIIVYTQAVCEENVENWLDNFVLPDLKERWSNGDMKLKYEIEEI